MRLLVGHHLTNAYESLRSNRMRTALTILGVTIGISSIVVILSLSAGAAQIVNNQVDQLGGTIAVIRPGTPDRESQINTITANISGSEMTSSLTERDVKDIEDIDHVTAVAPIMILGGSVSSDSSRPRNIQIIATTPGMTDVATIPMAEGQFIDTVTNDDTAVIGHQLSIDLFGTDTSVGRTFTTHGVQFTVIGILKRQNNPINFNNVDFDHAAIINLQSGKGFNQGIATIQQINIRATSTDKFPEVLRQVNEKLTRNHHGEKDFVILTDGDLARPSTQLFSTVSASLTAVASISLIVGGIGIMNILLVSVTERTREIGIRKALGASNIHIVWQFLIESLVMSLAGGIAGYFAGYIIAFSIARSFLTFDPVFGWSIVGASMGTSLIVGIVFGLYPAILAARKNPIEALRQFH
ncbi:MAG: putative transport system permease protein [Patescibacteria group bacterium]|nr:putative transport system permease protein [Patescibacteria group bacterium]